MLYITVIGGLYNVLSCSVFNFNTVKWKFKRYCFWFLLHVFSSLPCYKGIHFMFSSNVCKGSF